MWSKVDSNAPSMQFLLPETRPGMALQRSTPNLLIDQLTESDRSCIRAIGRVLVLPLFRV